LKGRLRVSDAERAKLGEIGRRLGRKALGEVSKIRPEILLPIVLSLVFVAAFQGSHDWGDLYALFIFGMLGWFMKCLGWPRPPMVLGLVIGGIFERYLFISIQLYGIGWLYRPVVLAILVLVAWALYRPLFKLGASLIQQYRNVDTHKVRLGASALFTLAIIAFIIAAIISSLDWPRPAQLVPLTACGIALVAATLNLINELFGPEQVVSMLGNADGGVNSGAGLILDVPRDIARRRATSYFVWLVVLMVLVALVGFIPAITLFIFANMRWGFGESWMNSLGYATATTLVCWTVFDWALHVAWPHSALGDMLPTLRATTGLI
jgi:putative tricarboxylic transport membrane protein